MKDYPYIKVITAFALAPFVVAFAFMATWFLYGALTQTDPLASADFDMFMIYCVAIPGMMEVIYGLPAAILGSACVYWQAQRTAPHIFKAALGGIAAMLITNLIYGIDYHDAESMMYFIVGDVVGLGAIVPTLIGLSLFPKE